MILDFWATWSFSLGLLSGVVLTIFCVTLVGEWFNNRQKKQENAERLREREEKRIRGLDPLSESYVWPNDATAANTSNWPQRRRVAR